MSLNPKEIVEYFIKAFKAKTEKSLSLLVIQGIMSGIFIGLGSIAYINILASSKDPGVGLFLASAVFPIGIVAILLLGYELFTSDTMAMIAVYNKTYKMRKAMRLLTVVWTANFIGCLLVVFAVKGANIFTPKMIDVINYVGEAKAGLGFGEMFIRAILCNILVCGGVMMALTAKDNVSKIVTIWLAVVAFIISKGEHSVANMFFLPAAMMSGANITVLDIAYNLIFVTLGNFVGGALIIGGSSYLSQIKASKKAQA